MSGKRKLGLTVSLLAAAAIASAASVAAGPIEGTPPYPPSDYITSLTLDWGTLTRLAPGSDNWPTTWAADGNVYTSWGDGGGFGEGAVSQAYVSIGVARLTGRTARTVQGTNLIGGLAPTVARCFPAVGGAQRENWLPAAGYPRPCYQIGLDGKSRTVLALGDKLHAFVTPGSWTEGYREARLYRARIGTNVWQRAGWAFTKGTPYRLLTPGLLQAGRDHADLGGGYVYAYATRYAPSRPESDGHSVQRGPNGGEIMLLRAPRGGDLLSKAVWRLFAGLDGAGRPTWTADPARMRPVIVDRNGVGWASSAVYVRALGRYLVATQHTLHGANHFSLLEAREPWGPWRTVAYTTLDEPAEPLPPSGFFHNFLANSFSEDGTRFTLAYTGGGRNDALVMVDGAFALNPAAR